jgi:hypothetical protein
MLIKKGTEISEDKIRTAPQEKSIQLAKSFSIPKRDFIKRMIPKDKRIIEGSFIPAPKRRINPASRSIKPKILTSMFFK